MGQVTRAKHGLDERRGIKGMAGFRGGRCEEAEGVGVETVQLAFIAKAGDDSTSACERLRSGLVRELSN